MRFVVLGIGLIGCAAAFAFALLMLGGVFAGAAHDAQLLGLGTWLLLVSVPAAAAWLLFRG